MEQTQNIIQTMENLPISKTMKSQKQIGVYNLAILTKKVVIPVISVGKNIRNLLEKLIANKYEGQCDVDGYIRKGSTRIITYSSGILKGSDIIFEVVFECLVCYPVEGMLIQCQVKNVTKAGIRADIPEGEDDISPVVIFVARDHHLTSSYFALVQSGQSIQVRVIGSRFELNDKYVSVIAELVEPKNIPNITRKSLFSEVPSSKQSSNLMQKTMKATTRGKQQVKPLSTIISEEEVPIETQDITTAAPDAQQEVILQKKEKTAEVEEPEPEFKPASIPIQPVEENINLSIQEEPLEAPLPLQEPVIQPTVAKPSRRTKKKLIIKEDD